ncbi:MAG: hypothetical protein ACRCVN_02420 [Spirochaetia bacterium]
MKKVVAMEVLVRFLCMVFLFAVLGYVTFITGIVNPSIPQGMVGVSYSSTKGYALVPESFFWSWQRFIPGNFRIYALDNTPRDISFDVFGMLPDAAMVQSLPQFSQANLRYELTGKLEYRLSLEGLIWSLSNHYLKPNNLGEYYTNLDEKIQSTIASFLINHSNIWVNKQDPVLDLLSELKQAFPHIEFIDIIVQKEERPDILAYQQGIDLITLDHTLRKEAEIQQSRQNIALNVEQERRLKLLEQYGALLSKYPVLVAFFAVDEQKILPRDVLENFIPSKALLSPNLSTTEVPPASAVPPRPIP